MKVVSYRKGTKGWMGTTVMRQWLAEKGIFHAFQMFVVVIFPSTITATTVIQKSYVTHEGR